MLAPFGAVNVIGPAGGQIEPLGDIEIVEPPFHPVGFAVYLVAVTAVLEDVVHPFKVAST